jgi:isopentenyl diphosphate isomerase/L-lactate dehydrogenase-like FMN-dependent dehydrogenase
LLTNVIYASIKVFVGRPLIWGLAVGGETGARKILQIFRDEFDLTMALMGNE